MTDDPGRALELARDPFPRNDRPRWWPAPSPTTPFTHDVTVADAVAPVVDHPGLLRIADLGTVVNVL
jgi:hypothetical protein